MTKTANQLKKRPINLRFGWPFWPAKFEKLYCTLGCQQPRQMSKQDSCRRQKRKMLGGEISVPCPPTVERIQQEKEKLIRSGEIAAGEPCSPYTLSRWVVKDGQLSQQTIQVFGRKIPLLSLRQKMLKQHENAMCLETDEQIQAKSREEFIHRGC